MKDIFNPAFLLELKAHFPISKVVATEIVKQADKQPLRLLPPLFITLLLWPVYPTKPVSQPNEALGLCELRWSRTWDREEKAR